MCKRVLLLSVDNVHPGELGGEIQYIYIYIYIYIIHVKYSGYYPNEMKGIKSFMQCAGPITSMFKNRGGSRILCEGGRKSARGLGIA